MKVLSWTLPLLPCLCTTSSLAAQERPNVLFILADDLGYGELSCYGQERFETPAIDALALEGMRFAQAYAETTVSEASSP